VSTFDEWVGRIIRYAATIALASWVVYALADYAWKRASMAWKTAALHVWRRDVVLREMEKRAKKGAAPRGPGHAGEGVGRG
jgi:hypothetical protein